ncbi:protein cab-1 isoform X2 [Dendroctonus ponderosae]|uniref:protein cab-1 isoform X2 n=1 Tax=Dendroctonus ponderosae TaxID=77166 RepID=UPI00203539E4|nr:protein cab-1 isoform X2 [Dendroctonus ponderosae]
MPRTLLISDGNGRDLKPYGLKKVRTNMKFSFIISLVIVFLWHGIHLGESRILNERNYLEFLNDLDRRNVEFDDIHQQWPFSNVPRNADNTNVEEPELEEDDSKSLTPMDNLAKIAELKAEMENRRNQKYQTLLGSLIANRPDHADNYERIAPGLSQYTREEEKEQLHDYDNVYTDLNDEDQDEERQESAYMPVLPGHIQALEHAQVPPAYVDDVPSFIRVNDMPAITGFDNRDYEALNEPRSREEAPNKMGLFENEYTEPEDLNNRDKELIESRIISYKPSFPRIVTEVPPFTEHKSDTSEEEQIMEENPAPKPSFPPAYFPRLVAPDLPVNYKIDGFEFGLHHKPQNDRFKFRDNPDVLKHVSLDTPSELGFGPIDPRFYQEFPTDQKDIAPKHNTVHPYLRKIPSSSNIDSRDNSHLETEAPPDDEPDREFFNSKDVEVVPFMPDTEPDSTGVYIIAIVAGISAAATVGLIAVGIGWYNLQKHIKNAEDTDYPSYGIVGPNKEFEKKERDEAGDRRLAQSAQMYHYQHQKQQIIAMGRNPHGHGSQSDTEEDEDDEGNYTVYECPGLASIEGPLEVKNPMFDDDELMTPSQTPSMMPDDTDPK